MNDKHTAGTVINSKLIGANQNMKLIDVRDIDFAAMTINGTTVNTAEEFQAAVNSISTANTFSDSYIKITTDKIDVLSGNKFYITYANPEEDNSVFIVTYNENDDNGVFNIDSEVESDNVIEYTFYNASAKPAYISGDNSYRTRFATSYAGTSFDVILDPGQHMTFLAVGADDGVLFTPKDASKIVISEHGSDGHVAEVKVDEPTSANNNS